MLLESGPGHATRCLPSPFAEEFAAEKRRLRDAGWPSDEVRDGLERLNIGRLRIAAKGVDRNPSFGRRCERAQAGRPSRNRTSGSRGCT